MVFRSKLLRFLVLFYFGTILLLLEDIATATAAAQAQAHKLTLGQNELASPPPAPIASDAKVRLGLRLTPYATTTPQAEGKPDKELRYTLRADLTKANHFFFHGYHIETTPLRWNKRNGNYAMRLNLTKVYGEHGEVEELLGDMTVSGHLKEQEEGLFVLHGMAAKNFKNKFGRQVLDLIAGYQAGTQISSTTPAKAGVSLKP